MSDQAAGPIELACSEPGVSEMLTGSATAAGWTHASDCDRMLEAFLLALPEVGRPGRNGWSDNVADVLAWPGLV